MAGATHQTCGTAPWPLVSVVVAAYNGERHIAQTMQAVLEQSYPRVQIILVDDGSTDATVALVQQQVPNAQIIKKVNGGVSSARNAGAAAAHGEFVCFLDQDDVWAPHHLHRQMEAIRDRPECGVVVSPYRHWYPAADEDPAAAVSPEPADSLATDPLFTGWVFHQFMRDCWALTSATNIRLDAFRAVGGFDETRSYAEDWDLWLRLSRVTQFVKVCAPAVLYRQHNEQGSRVARPVDHRTALLLEVARTHGLASRDGRAITPQDFNSLIARYQMEFGRHHLQFGQRRLAATALLKAWLRVPQQFRYLAWALVALSGFRPKA